jgi:hemerythrin-like domain-containing protein
MNGREIVEAFLREHTELREKLRECAAAQSQAADGNYGQCLHAVSVLRELCHLLEHEVAHHFREEETALYAFVQDRLPQLKPTVVEFQQEHDVIRQAFDEFRRELGQFNTSGELGRLPALGRDLVAYLRQHMDREEAILHPVILKEFQETDWVALRRLFVDAEVA